MKRSIISAVPTVEVLYYDEKWLRLQAISKELVKNFLNENAID